MNFANVTLGELLSDTNEIIKRNALSILKQKQKQRDEAKEQCHVCGEYFKTTIHFENGNGSKLNMCHDCAQEHT